MIHSVWLDTCSSLFFMIFENTEYFNFRTRTILIASAIGRTIRLDSMSDRKVTSGKDARFFCSVSEGGDVALSWTFGGALLKSDNSRYRIVTGAAESILTILNVRANNAGVYTCVGKNRFAEHRVSASLLVEGVLRKLYRDIYL